MNIRISEKDGRASLGENTFNYSLVYLFYSLICKMWISKYAVTKKVICAVIMLIGGHRAFCKNNFHH